MYHILCRRGRVAKLPGIQHPLALLVLFHSVFVMVKSFGKDVCTVSVDLYGYHLFNRRFRYLRDNLLYDCRLLGALTTAVSAACLATIVAQGRHWSRDVTSRCHFRQLEKAIIQAEAKTPHRIIFHESRFVLV